MKAACCRGTVSAVSPRGVATIRSPSTNDAHPRRLANGSDAVGRHSLRHDNIALIAFSRDRKDTVFQKTLSITDFSGPSEKWEYPMGTIQMLGKWDDWRVRGQAPKGLGWAPPAACGIVGKHPMEFWLANEDLPLPGSRVTLRPDGSIKLAVQPDNNSEGVARLRHTFDGMLTDLGMHSQSFERNLYLSTAMDVSATAHQAGTARFGADADDHRRAERCHRECSVSGRLFAGAPEQSPRSRTTTERL